MEKGKMKEKHNLEKACILYLAAHNCSVNYIFGKKISKRVISSAAVLADYLDNFQKQDKKRG